MALLEVNLLNSDQTIDQDTPGYDPGESTTIGITALGSHTLTVDGIDATVEYDLASISIGASVNIAAVNDANVTIDQGTLSLTTAGNFTYTVGDTSSITLQPATLGVGVLSGQTIVFTGEGGGSFVYDANPANLSTTSLPVEGFDYGDSIDVTGSSFQSFSYDSGTGDVTLTYGTFSTGQMQFVLEDIDPDLAAEILADPSAYINDDGAFVAPVCFLAGTTIAIPGGEALVEELAIGDVVLTADGEARPVLWIGRKTFHRKFGNPLLNYPIRIAAGALGEAMPIRDLRVSVDHAFMIDGLLIQAGALVNGSTILREKPSEIRYTYYHIELEDHALVLANGVPAETFVDNVTRSRFDNYGEYERLYGARERGISEMNCPRVKSTRQIPSSIREKLEERARILGLRHMVA